MGGTTEKTVYVEQDTSHLDEQIKDQERQIEQLINQLSSMSSNLNKAMDEHDRQIEKQKKAIQAERRIFEERLKKQNNSNKKQQEKQRKDFEKKIEENRKLVKEQTRIHRINMKLLYRGQIQSLEDYIKDQTKQVEKSRDICNALQKKIEIEEKQINKFKIERNDPNCKVLKMIGPTGVGKSTFCNRFLGDLSERGDKGKDKITFKVGEGIKSETEIISKTTTSRGAHRYVVIDTPGSADSQGRDKHFMNLIIQYLRGCGGVNAFLVFCPLVNTRLDIHYQYLLDEYQDRMGGKKFWKNVIVVFTKYDLVLHDYNGNKKKAKKRAKAIINGIREKFKLKKNSYAADSDSDSDDESEEKELFEEIKIPFICIGKNNYNEAIEKLISIIPKDRFTSKELKSPYDDMKSKHILLLKNYKILCDKLKILKQRKKKHEQDLKQVNMLLNSRD